MERTEGKILAAGFPAPCTSPCPGMWPRGGTPARSFPSIIPGHRPEHPQLQSSEWFRSVGELPSGACRLPARCSRGCRRSGRAPLRRAGWHTVGLAVAQGGHTERALAIISSRAPVRPPTPPRGAALLHRLREDEHPSGAGSQLSGSSSVGDSGFPGAAVKATALSGNPSCLPLVPDPGPRFRFCLFSRLPRGRARAALGCGQKRGQGRSCRGLSACPAFSYKRLSCPG